jgi:TRAP-type uncharacterized transport system substrate-binding protein
MRWLLLLLSVSLSPALAEPLRLCTGSARNPYHNYGEALATKLKGKLDVAVKLSRGSWDNLEGLDSGKRRCDAAIAQEDALILYLHNRPRSEPNIIRVAPVFQETVHLVCNRAVETDSLYGLHHLKHKIVANRPGSGTYVTWELFQQHSSELRALTGPRASFQDGMLNIIDQKGAHCMAFVARIGNSSVELANRGFGRQLMLVSIPPTKFAKLRNTAGRRVYKPMTIPAGTYAGLADEPVETVATDAFFLVSKAWKSAAPEGAFEALVKAVEATRPSP